MGRTAFCKPLVCRTTPPQAAARRSRGNVLMVVGGGGGAADADDGEEEEGKEDDGNIVGVEDGIESGKEEEEEDWFTVSTAEVDAAAAERPEGEPSADDGVLDLGDVDDAGRGMMTVAGYARVVNVDVDAGGALEADEDNGDLFSGVGFDALIEDEDILDILEDDFGYKTATHVQCSAIPRIADGSDVMVQSYTGTGKTIAFLVPIIEAVDVDDRCVQAVVVAPTRELAMQILREAERLAKGSEVGVAALIGGANPARQAERLRFKTPHIVVGTPGRLAELHGNRVLKLRSVKTIVVDEIDQCMAEGFVEHVEYIFEACPRERQLVFVSATGDNDDVRSYSQKWMREPELLRIAGERKVPANIKHWCSIVPARLRIDILRRLMTGNNAPKQAICFVDNPRRVDIVCERLFQMKLSAGALRGNAHKLERAEVLRLFKKGAVPLLVTTEIAARGLDIPAVSHVFNLDLPTDVDHYIHRAGRTGRAGLPGTVVTIATAETGFVIGKFESELGFEIKRMEPRGGVYAEPLERIATPRPAESRERPSEGRSASGGGAQRSQDMSDRRREARQVGGGEISSEGRRGSERDGRPPRREHDGARDSRFSRGGSTRGRESSRGGRSGEGESSFRGRESGAGAGLARGDNDRRSFRSGGTEKYSEGSTTRGGYPSSRGGRESYDRGSREESSYRDGGMGRNAEGSVPRGGYSATRGGRDSYDRGGRDESSYQGRGVDSSYRGRGMERSGGSGATRGGYLADRGGRDSFDRDGARRGGRQFRDAPSGRRDGDRFEGSRFDDRPGRDRDTGRGGGRGGRGGGMGRGGKPSGAELRLQNRESKLIRESQKKGALPTRNVAPTSTSISFADDDADDDGGGWVFADEKKSKKKMNKNKSVKERAKDGGWVGNRTGTTPKSD